jgi:hypothetical protein
MCGQDRLDMSTGPTPLIRRARRLEVLFLGP